MNLTVYIPKFLQNAMFRRFEDIGYTQAAFLAGDLARRNYVS